MPEIAIEKIDEIVLSAHYLLDRACFPEGAHILHLGCQNGTLLGQVLEARPDLHCSGIDTNEESIALARARSPSSQFALADLHEPLPLRGPFDQIFSCGIAQKFTPLQFVELNERLSRYLMPKGVLHHLAIPNAKQSFQYIMNTWQKRHGSTVGYLFGSVDGMITKWTHRYDTHSYWHDPDLMQSSLAIR